ncbi:MAG: energy-coupling factor transporter ATPase [Atribacterota bacterium]
MIEFRNVSFWYGEEETVKEQPGVVLNTVSLSIREREFVVLLGRNGSGKSTLAKHCNALLLPKRGSVFVDGMDTKEEQYLWEIRRKVGLVFQNPDNQLIATTVEEDVAFGPENLGLPPAEIRLRVNEALEIVGMRGYEKKEPHTLSGGQKQKIAIAGVLAMRPAYLVLDEATSMLDPEGRKDLMDLLLKLRDTITVLHITHQIEEAVYADRVIVMDEGRVMVEGTPREVFSLGEKIIEWGLELPQIVETALILKKYHPSCFSVFPLHIEELVLELC